MPASSETSLSRFRIVGELDNGLDLVDVVLAELRAGIGPGRLRHVGHWRETIAARAPVDAKTVAARPPGEAHAFGRRLGMHFRGPLGRRNHWEIHEVRPAHGLAPGAQNADRQDDFLAGPRRRGDFVASHSVVDGARGDRCGCGGPYLLTERRLRGADAQVQLQGRLDGHALGGARWHRELDHDAAAALNGGKIVDAGRNVGQRGQRVPGIAAAGCQKRGRGYQKRGKNGWPAEAPAPQECTMTTESPPGTQPSRLAASRRWRKRSVEWRRRPDQPESPR